MYVCMLKMLLKDYGVYLNIQCEIVKKQQMYY